MGRRYPRLTRLLRLVHLIQSRRGQSVKDLARICEVHTRTMYRDIEVLNSSGIPCGFDEESAGYRVQPGFFMPPIELTFEEAMAMVVLLEQTSGSDQVPFLNVAERVAGKIRSQLPPQLIENLAPLDGHVTVDLARTCSDQSAQTVYDDVRHAIAKKRMLQCRYDSASSSSGTAGQEFDLKPYQLWYCQRAWYVVGHHGGHGEVRVLKLNRFTSVKRADRPYGVPDDFRLADHLGLAWRMMRGKVRYKVAVRFDKAVADSVTETRWHPTQEEEFHVDQSVTIRFTVDGLDEIVWWVLGYGPHAKVLEPAELVEQVRMLCEQAYKQYIR